MFVHPSGVSGLWLQPYTDGLERYERAIGEWSRDRLRELIAKALEEDD